MGKDVLVKNVSLMLLKNQKKFLYSLQGKGVQRELDGLLNMLEDMQETLEEGEDE